MSRKFSTLRLIFITLAILITMSISNKTMATEFKTMTYNEKYIEWLNLSEEEKNSTIAPAIYVTNINSDTLSSFSRRLVRASIKYNLLDDISLKVKNQMGTNQCWAFSATTQLESYMAEVNSKTVEYSPRHMEYSTVKTFLDGTNEYGFNRQVNSGGTVSIAYAYMTNGSGPVLEKDMPFVNTSQKINLSDIKGKTVQAQLKEYIEFPSIYKEINNGSIKYTNGQTDSAKVEYTQTQVNSLRNKVKEHIMNYGAVLACTSTQNTQFFSNQEAIEQSKAYNCNDTTVQADHQVAIVGWDDNYAISNFKETLDSTQDHRPTSPGAWIVQNSYGEDMFNNGYIYISYEDCLIETIMTGIISLEQVDYDDIYQYDILGMTTGIQAGGKEIATANVFEKNSKVEYLNQVGIYTLAGESYDIYVNSTDGSLGKNLVKVKTVSATDSSYITVDLDNPIKLSGEKFAIAVLYKSADLAFAPVECKATYVPLYDTATSNAGESFVSADGTNWIDCSELKITGLSNINACIKAFTTNTTDVTIKSDAYTINDEEKIITNILPQTNVANLKSRLITNGTIKIFNKNGQELTKTELVGTGATLKIVETNDVYKTVVIGDLNGDGKITSTDLLKLKKHVTNIEKLKSEYKIAADINFSNTITTTDVLKMKQIICKIITL